MPPSWTHSSGIAGSATRLAEYRDNVLPAPMPYPLATSDVQVEPPSSNRRTVTRSIGITTGPFGARRLPEPEVGRNGEEWVVGVEREQLLRPLVGPTCAARRVDGARFGDGAGFDVASYRPDGTPLHIEVKTTNLGLKTPFHITPTRWRSRGGNPRSGRYTASSTSEVIFA